jgi:hypothetical protein
MHAVQTSRANLASCLMVESPALAFVWQSLLSLFAVYGNRIDTDRWIGPGVHEWSRTACRSRCFHLSLPSVTFPAAFRKLPSIDRPR